MTVDEMRRAGTLALVIRWAHAREEMTASTFGTREHNTHRYWEGVMRRELDARGVNTDGIVAAIDADGSRS